MNYPQPPRARVGGEPVWALLPGSCATRIRTKGTGKSQQGEANFQSGLLLLQLHGSLGLLLLLVPGLLKGERWVPST